MVCCTQSCGERNLTCGCFFVSSCKRSVWSFTRTTTFFSYFHHHYFNISKHLGFLLRSPPLFLSTCSQARAQRQRQSYQAAKVSAALDLRAEAYLDWQCVRCTFINTHDQATCQGCGGKNLRRKRRLRERRKEVDRLERLQSARETRDRRA